jgi:hypothetical protein
MVAFVSVAAGTCLTSCCPETALVYLPFSRLLHSNGNRLNSRNAIQFKILKNVKIKIYGSVFLPLVLRESQTRSFVLKEGYVGCV